MNSILRIQKQFEISEDDFRTELDAYIRDRAETYSPPIVDTLLRNLREELIAGVRAGERVSGLRRRVRRVLVDQAPDRISKIVRTEIVGAMNRGAVAAYRRSGVSHKRWLTARDGRVRGGRRSDRFDHRRADGQTVPVDQPFEVGGELLMHPGDPNGSPGNIVRCRCTVVPVLRSPISP